MEPANHCHCCLERPSEKDLKAPHTQLGMTETYSTMIEECFVIQLSLDNVGECGICEVCIGRLRDACYFKLQVQRSQATLQRRFKRNHVTDEVLTVKSESDDDRTDAVTIPEESNESEDDEDRTCGPVLRVEFPSKTEKANDAASDDAEDCKSLACLDATTPEAELLRPVSALAEAQPVRACSASLERLRGDEAPHASQMCLATSRHGPGLASRMKDMPDDTAGHRAEEQADKPCVTYSCNICSQEFSCEIVYRKHVNAHMNNETYTCDMCSAEFRTKATLIKHIGAHTVGKSRPCTISNKAFVNKDVLKQHQVIRTQKKPYSCKECDKQFSIKTYLVIHSRTHTGEKPYSCKECDKRFISKAYLAIHLRIHTGVKPYSCKECYKQFAHKTSLVVHERIHTGEKPYSCKECDKRFRSKTNLDVHMIIHSEKKPYICKECNREFTTKQHLNTHKKCQTVKQFNLKYS